MKAWCRDLLLLWLGCISEGTHLAHKRAHKLHSWWRHQMETFSALLAICAGNSPVPGEFPTQRPVTRSFDVHFDLRPNKRLSKQWWGWWFETPSRPLWRHRNGKYCRRVLIPVCVSSSQLSDSPYRGDEPELEDIPHSVMLSMPFQDVIHNDTVVTYSRHWWPCFIV